MDLRITDALPYIKTLQNDPENLAEQFRFVAVSIVKKMILFIIFILHKICQINVELKVKYFPLNGVEV